VKDWLQKQRDKGPEKARCGRAFGVYQLCTLDALAPPPKVGNVSVEVEVPIHVARVSGRFPNQCASPWV